MVECHLSIHNHERIVSLAITQSDPAVVAQTHIVYIPLDVILYQISSFRRFSPPFQEGVPD